MTMRAPSTTHAILWPQRLVAVRRSLNHSSRLIVLFGLFALGGSALWVTYDNSPRSTNFQLLDVRSWFHPAYINSLLITAMMLYAMRQVGRTREKLMPLGYPLLGCIDEERGVEVWRSVEPLSRRPVHLHLIRPAKYPGDRSSWKQNSQSWIRRAERSRRLSSPHIAQVIDVGYAQYDYFYAVMEMPSGLRLDQLIARYGALPLDRSLYLIAQIAHAVGDAHAHKQYQITLDPRHIWVGQRTSNEDWITVELHGYEEPDQARDNSERDDQRDLAVVAYGMLTGDLTRREALPSAAELDRALQARGIPHLIIETLGTAMQPGSTELPPVTELVRRMWEAYRGEPWNNDRAAAWWHDHPPQDEA